MRYKITITILKLLILTILIVLFLSNTLLPTFVPLENISALSALDPKILEIGKDEMKKHKVVFSGITRDNAKELPVVIKHLEETGSYFKDYRVIIFENDSEDGTQNILQDWKLINPRVKIISKNYSNKKRPSIAFLAEARNHYLTELKANPEYKDFDLVMVVDLDMKYGWDMRGLLHSFSHFPMWEAICSNGIYTHSGRMWDAFSFRSSQFPADASNPEYWRAAQRIYPVGSPLMKVTSCFGGLTFYKRSYIENCQYASLNEECEHIAFHECLQRQGGRMFMNPSQILRYSVPFPSVCEDKGERCF